MAEYNCYIFHDITRRKAFSVDNIYDRVYAEYIDSAVHVQVELSLMENHEMDAESLLIHSYSKMLGALMSTNEWFLYSALYIINVNIQILAQELYEQQRIDPVEYINLDQMDHFESDGLDTSIDSAYGSENLSADSTGILNNINDETSNTSSSAYYSEGSFSNTSVISGRNANNNIEDIEMREVEIEEAENEMEQQIMQDEDFVMFEEIIEEEPNLDADDEDDGEEESETDKEYYKNHRFYKKLKNY